MFGLTIVKKSELNRLRNIDEIFCEKISEKETIINMLKAQVESLTRKRNAKGQFIK